MLKHSDIIEKLNTLQKAAIISSALDAAPFEQAGIPAVRRALLRELAKTCGVSYASAVRSWDPALVGDMTGELVLEAAEKGDKLFLTPDLKTAVNPYEEGLSEDACLNGAMGADIIRGIHGVGAAAGLARPSVGIKEIEYLDRSEDAAAVHELIVKPFIGAVKNAPCEAVFMSPLREGTGYYNTNRAIFGEVQNGLLGEDVFLVGEGVNSSADAVALLNGKISLGGAEIPLERAARRYVRLKEYEAEGSVASREIEDSLKDGTAISGEKIDALLDEIIDFALALDGSVIRKEVPGSGTAKEAEETVTMPEDGENVSVAEENAGTAEEAVSGSGTAKEAEETVTMPEDGENVSVAEENAGTAEEAVSETVAVQAEEAGNTEYEFPIPAGVPAGSVARYRAAAESVVLLKNDAVLPLPEGTKICVLGEPYKDLDLLREKFEVVATAAGYDRSKARSESLIPTALRVSAFADAVVVFIYPDAEGRELALPPNRIALLDSLKRAKKRVIAVICGDMPVDMSFDKSADAVLVASDGGAFAGDALARVLCGEINPSGRLTRTFHDRADEYFANLRADRNAGVMNVGSFVGYLRYATDGKKVRYPFGFGLSYTEFRYSGLELGEDEVRFTLTNCGKRDGSEVAQIYIGVPSSTRVAPKKQLRAFRKVFLRAGESKKITVPLPAESFETFDANLYADNVEAGEYAIYVGASPLDIRLSGKRTLAGVVREPLKESKSDYFPDSEYDDVRDVTGANRIGKTPDKTPLNLKRLHTAALFALPLIAVTFFLLVSVLILSYALDYILLSVAEEETVEWILYIFAILIIALCPLLGRFNRKRLAYSRTVALVLTPVFITVCFVFGAVLQTSSGGIAERLSLRVVTCLAIGFPLFAVVSTLIERQLWRTKTGNNRWDKYYFSHERSEKPTSDKEFEAAFRAVEEARKKKNAPVKELPREETEVVGFYDRSLTYAQLVADCGKFIAERGLKVADGVLRNWIAAIFSTQLIIIPAGGGAELCEAVSAYFGKKAVVDNAAGYRRYDDLFTRWRQSGNADVPTGLSAAISSAMRESAYLHTVLIRHVDKGTLETLFSPFASVMAHKISALPPAGGKNYVLPHNLLIVAEAETDDLKDIPAGVAEVAAVVSPVCEKCPPVPVNTAVQAVGYELLDAMRRSVRDSYSVDEDLWKKVDLLDGRCKISRINNRLWVKLETHSSFLAACGADGKEALDGALSAELMPWISSVWDEKICGGELSKVLLEIFGEDLTAHLTLAKAGEETE